MPLRLIFMGTPEFAVPTLLELAAPGHEIAAVYAAEGDGLAALGRDIPLAIVLQSETGMPSVLASGDGWEERRYGRNELLIWVKDAGPVNTPSNHERT